MAVIRSEGDSESSVFHSWFCRLDPGIGFGRCPVERGAWVLLQPRVARRDPSSFVLVTALRLGSSRLGRGQVLRVQACLYFLDQGLITFLSCGGENGTKKELSTLWSVQRLYIFLGQYTIFNTFSKYPMNHQTLDAINNGKTLKPFRIIISCNNFNLGVKLKLAVFLAPPPSYTSY